MMRDIHKIYDIILKIIILNYSIEFLKYVGEDRQIAEILKTEISTLNGKTRHLDFLAQLEDGSLCKIEFQFPAVYKDDLKRFFDYNIVAQIRYGEITESIIFSFGKSSQGFSEIKIGQSKDFHPRIFHLGDIDFEKEMESIIQKVNSHNSESFNNNDKQYIKLTYKEELHMLLMSLAPKYKDKKAIFKPIVELLKKEEIFRKEKYEIIRYIIKFEMENLLTPEEKIEFEEDMKMNDNIEDIFERAISEVSKKYQQEAIDEAEERGFEKGKKAGYDEGKEAGYDEGKEAGYDEGKRDLAKKLKGKLSADEISKLTGLSLNTIIQL